MAAENVFSYSRRHRVGAQHLELHTLINLYSMAATNCARIQDPTSFERRFCPSYCFVFASQDIDIEDH
jgi:hypothetical protein